MATLEETISQFPYTKESAEVCYELFRFFYPKIVDPKDDSHPDIQSIPSYRGFGEITRAKFTELLLGVVSQRVGWENLQGDQNLYEKILEVNIFYEKSGKTQVERSLPPELWLKEQLTELPSTKSEEIKESVEKRVRSDIERQKRFYEKETFQKKEEATKKSEPILPVKQDVIKEQESPAKIFVVQNNPPSKIKLTPEQKEVLAKLATEVGKENFVASTAEKIKNETKKSMSAQEKHLLYPAEIDNISTGIAEDLNEFFEELPKDTINKLKEKQLDEIEVETPGLALIALTTPKAEVLFKNPEAAVQISQSVEEFQKLHNEHSSIMANYMSPITGSGLAPIIYPTITKEQADSLDVTTKKPAGKSIAEINKEQLKQIQEYALTKRALLRALKEKYPEARIPDSEIEKLTIQLTHLNKSFNALYFATSSVERFSKGKSSSLLDFASGRYGFDFNLITDNGKPILEIGFRSGQKFIPFKQVGGKIAEKVALASKLNAAPAAVKTSVTKAVAAGTAKLIAKLGLKGALASLLGTIAPIVGHILGWIAGELLTRLLVWAKRHWREIMTILGGLSLIYAAFQGAWVIGIAGMGMIGLGTLGGLGGLGGFAIRVLLTPIGFLQGMLVTTFTTALVFIFIVLPIAVTLVLFIINSGAYIYPPNPVNIPGAGGGGGGTAISCFVLVDENKWPAQDLGNAKAAIQILVSKYPGYVRKLCSKGEIEIHWFSKCAVAGYTCWGNYPGGNDINVVTIGLTNVTDALHIIAHEAGHLLSFYAMPSTYAQYLSYPKVQSEIPICTYSATVTLPEAFAESIALYASGKFFSCLNGSFKDAYPIHWQFVHDNIFN